MEAIKPTTEPTSETPISEKTRAILEMHKELQDVTAAVHEIRQMMKKGETWRTALWRAVKQFIGDIGNGH